MKFAVFDVDGTLVNGSIGADFVEWLSKRNHFPKKYSVKIRKAIQEQEKGRISYAKRGELLIKYWALGFKGKKKSEIKKLALEFIESYEKIFFGSQELMLLLKAKNYYLIALSRAFEEILEALKSRLFFDCIIGTKFEVKQEKYTGKPLNEMWDEEIKGKLLVEVIRKNNFDLNDSLAFGDSEQDYFMMSLVERPICSNPSGKLDGLCENRGWKRFNSIEYALNELKQGKIVAEHSWFEHYAKKYRRLIMDKEMFEDVLKKGKPFLKTVKRQVKEKARLLETGCGLGRTVVALSLMDYRITAIDSDARLLETAKINTKNYGKKIEFREMNFFEVLNVFGENSFDAVTHQGVLEHFSDSRMKKLLKLQLKIAPKIIFSVPLKTKENFEYFKYDKIGHRNLWTKKKWKQFLSEFNVIEFFEAKQRTKNLIVVIKRKKIKESKKYG